MSTKFIITSEVFIAYSQCPRKAFLMLFSDDKGTPSDYSRIIEERKRTHQAEYLEVFKQEHIDVKKYDENNFKGNNFFVEARLQSDYWEAYCDILTKVDTFSSRRKSIYEPTIIIGTYSITTEQKTELLFIGKVLGQIQKQLPAVGRIVGMDGKAHRVKLESGYKSIAPFFKTLQAWVEEKPIEPPALILNKHCPSCQFRDLCREQAVKENNLSLLDRMTPKAIQRYNKKGIFTIHQLSYLFRLRRNKKKQKSKLPVKHSLELQALAIREQKIYIQDLPELSRKPVELFLDIEGIPDQNFHYLMGLLISAGQNTSYHSFWADTTDNEESVWKQLVKKINEYPEAVIYHYGSYEVKAINELEKRYSIDCELIKQRLINLNSYIYGKVYFPTYSNSLKAIGDFIGIYWAVPNSSGLQSIAWRYQWEDSREVEHQQKLIQYNHDDCRALKVLADEFCKILINSELQSNIDFANQPKKESTETGKKIHNQFDTILKFAHADYDKKKISIYKENDNANSQSRKRGGQKGHKGNTKIIPLKVNRVIHIPGLEICSRCHSDLLKEKYKIVEKIIIELVFLRNGCKKNVIKYLGYKNYCPICKKYSAPPSFFEVATPCSFGHGFKAWVVYQRLALRLPYQIIMQETKELFDESISLGAIVNFLTYFSEYYAETELILIKNILQSPFIHVDETQINIQGLNQYVWVFTDGKHVIFRLTKTREAEIVHEILSEYKGVLVSDFYGGYDSVNCKQQKCWSHLIRDINDDLWEAPFDTEFEFFVSELRNLIIPILETVEKYGLKKRHFNKFNKLVEKFYFQNIIGKVYHSELAVKYQKRFERYRQSLFTFLEQDGIPWNNNAAERAIRHLAIQRKISGSFYESGATAYLILLGIMQTCRFQDKSLLKFFMSGEKDIDKFKSPK
ncbi:IS66 family transposase [Nostoc sp. UIC 10607]|uniref:IS66 family transposase n=1 Tax=Nostoc sp. UIC 10607 TaxID=3045935 RepID=UPI0039A00F22